MSEISNERLAACPFCGGEAEHHDIGNEHTRSRGTEIWCTQCHFHKRVMAIRQDLSWTRSTAITAWNRRASPSGVEVKGFSWEANGATSLWTGELAFGVYYTAYDEGDGWRTFRQQFLSEASPAEIAFGPKYRALADAESDYRTRILSCLTSPSPNGVTVSEEMVERLTDELVKRQVFAPGATDTQIAKMRPLYIEDARAALLAALEGGSQT